jgi:ubiquitin-conjugating enzyme E2 G2
MLTFDCCYNTELMCDPPEGISAGPLSDADFFKWEAGNRCIDRHCQVNDIVQRTLVITGPEGTPYENGVFIAHLTFPSDYPFA